MKSKLSLKELAYIWLLSVLVFCLFRNFLPQANATLNGDNFVTEITGLSFDPYLVDVDSSGNLYVGGENDVWKSTDQGSTWTKVLDGATTSNRPYVVFVDSRDYVYAEIWKTASTFNLTRSTDNGATWTNILDGVPHLWHMAEDSSGNLYVNTYSTTAYIYRSTDSGASFSVWRNQTGVDDHFHSVGVDIANDDIYTLMGDTTKLIQKWNGESWSNITTGSNQAQPTDIWSDGSYVYFAPDGQTKVYRIPSEGTWAEKEEILDLKFGPQPTANFAFEAVKIENEDIYLMGTEDGQLWGTWDNLHWVKLICTGSASDSFFSISNRKPIYVVERVNNKLYRLDIQKEDLIHLYYNEYYSHRADVTNAESYILEQRITNGTNYVDLSSVGLSNMEASIIGLNKTNWFKNAGFETGDKTSWVEVTTPYGSVLSDSPANGTYYYARNHTASTSYLRQTWFDDYVAGSFGDIYLISFYVKGNISSTDAIQVNFYNGSYTSKRTETIDVTTSWVRHTYWYPLDSESTSARWEIRFLNKPLQTHLDSLMLKKFECGICRGVSEGDSIQYLEKAVAGDFTVSNLTTDDPTLTVDGETVTHSGTLTNGTESSATSLTGIKSGILTVSANIQGSGQAILRITGTRVLYEDSIILKGRTQNVYYGRYYGTLSLTTNTTDLLALTNLQANITSLSFDGSKLTLIVDSPSGTTSTTKVYCGDKGEPSSVLGATSWSYNSTSKILTTTATHSSSIIITVKWKFPGDVNGDGVVDASDLFDLSKAYGSKPGDPNWNPDCDFNKDDKVDASDLFDLSKNYGKIS